MLSLDDIKGQRNAVRFLSNCLSSGRIPNALLFYGPEGVGKALTARAFIRALICRASSESFKACGTCPACRRVEALEHPDVLWIRPEKNRFISIDQVRKAKDTLNLKPYEASRNICVIEDAHMMKPEAANAMLKMLEEPPAGSMVMLITSKKELLLPTVVSRCLDVKFRYLSLGDTREIVAGAAGVDEKTAIFLASFSQGSPGMAIGLVKEGLIERRNALFGMIESAVSSREAACLTWDDETKEGLIEDIELMLMFLRDVVFKKEGLAERVLDRELAASGAAELMRSYPLERIYKVAERLINLKQALIGNANPKIIAQALPSLLK